MFNIDVMNDGWLFTAMLNGRYVSEFVSKADASNRSEAIAIRIERLGH